MTKPARIVFLAFLTISVRAQCQPLVAGNLLIEGFVGGPSVYGSLVLKDRYQIDSNAYRFAMNNSGPRGLKAELMWGSRTGISFFYSYANTIATWQSDSVNPRYQYQVQAPRHNLLFTINYHFFKKRKKTDFYTITGLGYRFNRHRETSLDPFWLSRPAPLGLQTINCRLGLGYRRLFAGNRWTFVAETAIGGPFVVIGFGYITTVKIKPHPLNNAEE